MRVRTPTIPMVDATSAGRRPLRNPRRAAGEEDLRPGRLRSAIDQCHHVLEPSRIVRSARLIEGGARPQPAGEHLVHEPAIEHQVHRRGRALSPAQHSRDDPIFVAPGSAPLWLDRRRR